MEDLVERWFPSARNVAWSAVSSMSAALLAGCGAVHDPAPPAAAAVPWVPPSLERVDCAVDAEGPEEVQQAMADAHGGTTICVRGDTLGETDLVVEASGTRDRPVVLAAEGAQVRSIAVRGDFVVIQGFAVVDGEGIDVRGQGLVVRANEIRGAGQDGISCEEICADVLVEDNAVSGTDGTGIIVEGQRITVQENLVRGSVMREAGDADGIRFFGRDIRLLRNTITDIKDDGYDGDPPHTDCFQTYDNGRLPTVDVLIAGNVCRNVDHQCLIATAEEAGDSGEVGRSSGITFTGNECAVNGSQAVLVRWFPDVAVRDNIFEGRNDRAAYFLDGSVDGAFTGNSVPRSVRPYQLDGTSRDGFVTDVAGD